MKDPATKAAEAFLRAELAYNREKRILPSENVIIERLLGRPEMVLVYRELYKKLPPQQAQLFLGVLFSVAAFRDPEKTKKVREQLDRARRLNDDIAVKATELARLMRMRSDACKEVQLPDDHPVSLISMAGYLADDQKQHLFQWHVEPALKRLANEFDWPRTADLLDAIAYVQHSIEPAPNDSAVAAAVDSRTHSIADVIRAVLRSIDDAKRGGITSFPKSFSLTNQSIAEFINCALHPDPPCNAEQVRQRARDYKRKKDSSPEYF